MPDKREIKTAVFAAIKAANSEADDYGMDRAGIDVCAQAAIVEYLKRTGRELEAEEVKNVVT